MSINVNDKNLGHATAYAYYKAGGGTMTEAEFTEFMADFGTASQTAVEAAQAALASKNAAQTAATTATNKASEATTAATTATNKAAEAQADADAAALDASQAMSAASTATTKATEATTAAATATSAKTDAVAANTAAQSAKTAAQTAQTGAETAAASVSASAAQIATNAADISQLKSEFTALTSDGVVPSAEQIISDKGITDSVPYHYRKTGGDGADRLYDQIVGGTACFNQLCNDASVIVQSGRKYLSKIGTAWAVGTSTGTAITGLTSGADMIVDLAAMFGTAIADYIYDLETAHTGDGVAFFKSLFPNDYYPYNSGELVSVSGLSAHVMRDADDNIIRSYPLDSTLTLRGVPKLVDGKMCFDGDTYDADGTVTRKYGIVDLGTLTWTRNADSNGGYYFICNVISTMKKQADNYAVWGNLVIGKAYSKVPSATIALGTASNLTYGGHDSGAIRIKDDAYTDAATFKTAMSGVMLVYELATPTTEEADPYQHLQQCDPNGTEEYVSTGIVPVGHNSFYPENLRAKVEGLPWNFASLIAPTEATFVATRNYTTGSLFIVGNVLYKATSNIANGDTITPNTNCTATTLAEVISALA